MELDIKKAARVNPGPASIALERSFLLSRVADGVFRPADSVLNLSADFLAFALGFQLLVARHLASGLLYGAFDLMTDSGATILVH
jgi:hypothetical protein